MDTVNIQFLVPTYNNVQDIDATLQSIWEQDYSRERIYVTAMDFGSTDGTYEKLLGRDKYHFGVYRNTAEKNPRQRVAHMATLMEQKLNYVHPGGHCLMAVLYPGDVLYPGFLRTCMETLTQQGEPPALVICEADCWDDMHKTCHQSALFASDCIIHDGYQYVSRGYQHQIQCLVSNFDVRMVRFACAANEQRWWSKCDIIRGAGNALYIREPLLCQKKLTYEDELEEVLLRWESVVARRRAAEGRKISEQTTVVRKSSLWHRLLLWWRRRKEPSSPSPIQADRIPVESNIAEYSLWRSWLLCEKHEGKPNRDAEDCFLISKAIYPKIADSELYRNMQKYIMEQDGSVREYLEDYFATHGMN